MRYEHYSAKPQCRCQEMARPDKDKVDFRKNLLQTLLDCRQKPSKFASTFLGYEPFDYNAEYLDAPDKWIVYRAGRKVGKTQTTAAKCLHFAWYAPFMGIGTVKDRCDILIVAPTQNQANIMFDMIKTLVHRSEMLEGYILKEKADELWLEFIDGSGISRIYTRAAGERGDSIRGYVPHIIVADECAFIKRQVLTALIPAGIATNARVWMTSTPFGRSGYLYEACMHSRPGNKQARDNGIYQEDGKGRWLQFHVPSMMNPLVQKNPDALEELKLLTKDEYQVEVMGQFLEVGNALIPRHLITSAIGDYKMPPNVRYVLGVDIAGHGKDETVFIVIAYDDNGKVYVVESDSMASSTSIEVAGRAEEICRKYRGMIETVFMDHTALGHGAVSIAQEKGLPVRAVDFSYQEKEGMYRTLVLLFENGKIKLGAAEKLVYQLSYLQKEYTTGGNRLKVVSEEHDDWPDALALACKAVDAGDSWGTWENEDGSLAGIDDLF